MSEHTDETIRLTSAGAVATIWLNRPSKRNAMSYSMWAGLEELAVRLGRARDVRVVVLRGVGEHFCAGADIAELNVPRGADERTFAEVNTAAETALARLPKPTVAFVSGDCIGGGCSLAIDCDLRIATSTARFGITPANLGIVYPTAALERATHLLGPAATKRLLFTAELITAEHARRIGLVDEVVDLEAGEASLAALTSVLGARSLLTQAATKAMVAEVIARGAVPKDVERYWSEMSARASDSAEGIAAFLEKRAPKFTWSGSDVD